MDISIDDKTKDLILKIAQTYKDIKDVKEISSTPVGEKHVVFIKIGVDGNLSTFKSHELADNLEKSVSDLDKVYKTIVHVEPE